MKSAFAVLAALGALVVAPVSATPLQVYPGATPDPTCIDNPAGTLTQTRTETEREEGLPGGECRERTCDQERTIYTCPGGAPPIAGPWSNTSCTPWRAWTCGDPEDECRASPVSTSTETRSVTESIEIRTGTYAGQCITRKCDESRVCYECEPPQPDFCDPWEATGTCGPWSPPEPCEEPPPPQCPQSQTEERTCPAPSGAVQTRSRTLVADGDPCVWGAWSDWAPECPPVECDPPSETERRACTTDPAVEQSRTRLQTSGGSICEWQAWSEWAPECPDFPPCPEPEVEQRSCGDSLDTLQTRSRTSSRVGLTCVWSDWTKWAPECPEKPPECDRVELETNVCESDATVVQTRVRTERPEGGICVWNDWSVWAPACPDPDPSCSVHRQTRVQPCSGRAYGLGYVEPSFDEIRIRPATLSDDGVCEWGGWGPWRPASVLGVVSEPCSEQYDPPKPSWHDIYAPLIAADPGLCARERADDLLLDEVCTWLESDPQPRRNTTAPYLQLDWCDGELCAGFESPCPPQPSRCLLRDLVDVYPGVADPGVRD